MFGVRIIRVMFSVDTSEFKRLERDLNAFSAKAYPIANRFALNKTARVAMQIAREHVRGDMTLRNTFTLKSIQFRQATGDIVRLQESSTGSIASYMRDQEFGTTKRRQGQEGVTIPTAYAAGQGRGQRPRTRPVRAVNRLQAIQLRKQSLRNVKTRKQTNLVKVRTAVATGKRFVFLDMARHKGIFRVAGGTKRGGRGWPRGAKLQMVYDLSEQAVRIPANPWLGPTVERVQRRMPHIWLDALEFQVERLRLFKGRSR